MRAVPMPVARLGCGEEGGEGEREPHMRPVALETPVALEYNGIAYAVMMASPADLEDFAVGFTLSEGLAADIGDIADIAASTIEGGRVLRITLARSSAEPLIGRVRMRLSEGSCGLCGMESIEQVLRPLPAVTARLRVSRSAIFRALAGLEAHQPDGRATGALHAAAFCDCDGNILMAREDVGRHNAFDKLIGALARAGISPTGGFALLSARCSFELVEKAVRANCPMLVTVSAPTSLAVERAQASGLSLLALARTDSLLICNDPHDSIAR